MITDRWIDLLVPWCRECGIAFKFLRPASLHEHWQDIEFVALSELGAAARGIQLLLQLRKERLA